MNTLTPSDGQVSIFDGIVPPATFSGAISRNTEPETAKEAIARAGTNANPEWTAAATQVVRELCERRQEFTTDDVWEVLDTLDVSTKQRKSLGSVMNKAAETHWCQIKDCRPVPSRRAACHRRPIPIWESLLHPSCR